MSVKISELPILDSLADNDVLAGVDTSENVTKKIELTTLKDYIDTNTTYTAGTNIDITNNVVSAPNVYNKTETDEKIEELQNEVDSLSMIYNAFPTESGEGDNLTLDGTAEVKFKKFNLKGNTSQVSYTGKNLIPAIHSFTTSGITWTKNDNGITNISGTTTGSVTVYETSVANTPIKAGTYIFNATVTGTVPLNSSQVILQFNDGTQSILNLWSPSARTLTFENDTTIKTYYFYANSNMTFNASIAVQLEAGSSATTYEQYIGGKPSPRPDYPQRVEIVSGDNEINVTGRNLLEGIEYGDIIAQTGAETTSTGSIKSINYIPYYTNKTYYLSVNNINPTTAGINLRFYNKNKEYIGYSTLSGSGSNFNITKQTSVIDDIPVYFRFRQTLSAGPVTNLNDKVMLTTVNNMNYEPFGNTYNIDLPVENLFDKDNANTLNCLVNGTNGSIANYNGAKSLYIPIQSSKKYTISKILSARFVVGTCVSTPASGVTCNVYSANNTGTSITITSGASDKFLCVFYYLSGTDTLTEQQILDSIQIEVGSKANSYTPYGTTPIELCKIGNYQDGFAKSDGSNLFDKNLFNPFTSTIQYIDMTLKPNTTYTMSSNLPVTSGIGANLFFMKGGETAATGTNDIRPELTRTLTTDSTGNVRIGYRNAGSIINPITNCNYMLNEGSSALPYQPYGAGRWYKLENVRKLILDDHTSIYKHGSIKTDTKGFYQVQIPYKKTGGSSGATDAALSDYFKLVSGLAQSSFDNNSSGIWWESNSNPAIGYAYVIFEVPTIQEFSNWLGNYTPSLYYQTSTPKVEVITYQPLIDQLNLLEKAMSKEGQTNINQNNNDKPFIITAEAILSLQNVLDRVTLLES